MIELSGLNLKYRQLNNCTLKNINLMINPGEKVLIVGPSGSGKSTLGKLMNGLIPNSQMAEIEGDHFVYGLKLGSSSIFELSTKIGTIMQDQDSQFVGLNVSEDIAFYLENLNIDVASMHQRVAEIVKMLELEEIRDTDPSRLSGGEKQKVSLGGVLVNNVDCLLLDEPLANLDPETSVEVMQLIDTLNHDFNKTVIMIEHRLEDALIIDFDRLIVIEKGEVIANDSPTNILKSDVLPKIGVQRPLYIEALAQQGYDFSSVENMLDYDAFDLSKLNLDEAINSKKTTSEEELFSAENIAMSFGKHEVLKDVSFQIKKGEIVSLLGSNGAGKSTLCNAIVGINKNYKGSFKIDGAVIDEEGIFARASKVGYVMQNPNHYITETTVEEEVGFALKSSKISQAEIESLVDEALENCRLTPFKKWPINMLSYGQRRRVTIAACLVKKPKLLVLDEPTAGQDFETFKSIMDTVKDLGEKYELAVLVITHNMQLAYEYSHRAVVLNEGKIIFDGQISKLYEEDEILKRANLRSTSIQRFSQHHHIPSYQLGQCLLGGES